AASSSRAGTSTRRRSLRSRAASGGAWRSRLSSPRGRTSSSSTSRRTTSTSRAARRWRLRSKPFPGRCCSSRTTGHWWTRSPRERSRSRAASCAPTTAAGPTTCGRARRVWRLPPSRRRRRSRGSRHPLPRGARASSTGSRPRSPRARKPSPSSSAASPTTGETSRPSPPIAARATSCRRSSPGGRSSSSARRRSVDLWERTEQRIRSSCGWSLEPLRALGRPRDGRRTWVAQGEPGLVIVKASANPFAAAHAAWAPQALAALAGRGYPVPKLLWHGLLDERWSVVVLERLPGEPLRTLDDSALEALVALVELQRDLVVDPGGWDTAEWIELVLFDRWEGWWEAAEAAAPETSRRLQAFVEPARGHRLPGGDLVHEDLNLTNVLAEGGTITGVVDWDAIGYGSRASDLAGLLFDWHRLRLGGRTVATA